MVTRQATCLTCNGKLAIANSYVHILQYLNRHARLRTHLQNYPFNYVITAPWTHWLRVGMARSYLMSVGVARTKDGKCAGCGHDGEYSVAVAEAWQT